MGLHYLILSVYQLLQQNKVITEHITFDAISLNFEKKIRRISRVPSPVQVEHILSGSSTGYTDSQDKEAVSCVVQELGFPGAKLTLD